MRPAAASKRRAGPGPSSESEARRGAPEPWKPHERARGASLSRHAPPTTQPRVVEIEGDTLKPSTEKPIKSGGKRTMAYPPWKRAEPNA